MDSIFHQTNISITRHVKFRVFSVVIPAGPFPTMQPEVFVAGSVSDNGGVGMNVGDTL